jgi:hypothetical protein
MGIINYGNQTTKVQYKAQVTSNEVNDRLFNIIYTGIWDGGYLTKVTNTSVDLSPLSCEISDGNHQVRVSTADVTNISVSPAIPYIVLRWNYVESTGNYMDILALNSANVLTNDLIVGVCVFDMSNNLTGFSYSQRATPFMFQRFLRVEPTVPASMAVRIRAGLVGYGVSTLTIDDQLSQSFSAPVGAPRIDVICVNTSGAVFVIQGSESYTPVAPNYSYYVALAEITLTVGQTTITSASIKNVAMANKLLTGALMVTGNQTAAGVKTFSSSPIVPMPTTDYQAAPKKYVDEQTTYTA